MKTQIITTAIISLIAGAVLIVTVYVGFALFQMENTVSQDHILVTQIAQFLNNQTAKTPVTK